MLNQALNLRLPVHGMLDVQTRSAIRSFQEKNGLPVTGIVGPDTERALMGAKEGQAPAAGSTPATEPGMAEPSQPGAPSSEPEPTASSEPDAASPSAEFEGEGGFLSKIFNRVTSGQLTGTNLTPIEDRTAITLKKGFGHLRKGKRDLKQVYALVLHHTAGQLREKPEDLNHVNAHFVITPKGRILHLHPMESSLWASNSFNPRSVAVEFVGNFRNEKGICWYQGPRFLPCSNKPTPEQIKAGRDLVMHLRNKINLTHILAHRQSSSQRDGCPGPDIWYHVGQWAVDNFRLSDGGPGFFTLDGTPKFCKIGTFPEAWKNAMKAPNDPRNAKVIASIPESCKGKPIPDSWRNWGSIANQPELSIQREEEINPETPKHTRWLQRSLNHLLGLRLPEDGVLGPATRSALRSFQSQRKLDTSGVLNLRTERSLMAAGASPHRHPAQGEWFETLEFEALSSQPLLRRGSKGAAVVDLQKRLVTFGFSPGAADGIFGSLTEAAVKNFQRSRGLSADGIVGAQTWGALSGSTGTPYVSPGGGAPTAPVVRPTPAPALKDFPAAWSNGPVDAPPWHPQMVSYDLMTCGSREIPVGLRPESVTQGWTARTQAIVDIIRGPLFGWKNVEGGATGTQTGHISGSYHYCGRAIDSFAPGVLWNTRATGAGLSASWRLANWAAHNAATLNISQVIFYDRIWTAANGGWHSYTNQGLSADPGSANSLQHRDHVHISVF